MNLDYGSEPGKDDVRGPWKPPVMNSESKPRGMQVPAHGQLWLCVLPSYAAHHARAGWLVNDIYQSDDSSSEEAP